MSEITGNTLGLVRAFMRRQFPDFEYDREYRLLRPKVLFHTWVAIYRTGIFDGTFALPKTGRKFDYVTKIKSNARFLEKQRIPLMIVYSSLELPIEEERRMQLQFEDEPNVVVLNLERDLACALPEGAYRKFYTADLNLMDYLRIGVIKHAHDVLRVLRDAALARGKVAYARALEGREGNAIIYSDIDIAWNDRVPNVLAYRGMCSAPSLSRIFSFQAMCIRVSEEDVLLLSDRVRSRIREHAAMFDCNSREGRLRLFGYVHSGKAHNTVEELMRAVRAVQPEAYRKTIFPICRGENSLLYVHLDSVPLFREVVDDASWIVDFHPFGEPNMDPLRAENHASIFMQLLPFMTMGKDRTWHENGID